MAASSAPSWIQCLFDDLSLGVGGRRWAPFQDTRPPDISICQPRSSQEAVRRQSGGSPRPGNTPPPSSSPSGDFYNFTSLSLMWSNKMYSFKMNILNESKQRAEYVKNTFGLFKVIYFKMYCHSSNLICILN